MENQHQNSSYPSITNSLQQAAGEINQYMPKKDPPKPTNLGFQQPQPQQPEDPLIAKFRKWLLIGLSSLVGGTAILLIIWRVILKFT